MSLPSGLERYHVPVRAAQVTETIRRFRSELETGATRRHLRLGQRLYDWLVRPYAEALARAKVDTLVFVPGGALRTIPMAALHDGKDFLIRHYGAAVTPSLALTDPYPLDPAKAKLLLAGVSEPVQGFPPLTYVPGELEAIQRVFGGRLLLDREFTLDRLEKTISDTALSIVHIASHGTFTGEPESSFLLTYDGRLSMTRLNESIGVAKFREQPLELLVLSACRSAIGDDRAALGLAGIGIKAGARSAVGSLWRVSDEATAELFAEFYRQLKDPGVSKALALQKAQRKLLESPRFAHPFYWSPFLVINNWL